MSDELLKRMLAIGRRVHEVSGGRAVVARNEPDHTPDHDPEPTEHFKFHGHRVGRDFRVWALMAETSGVGQALSEFAGAVLVIDQDVPGVLKAVRDDMMALTDFLPPEHHDRWRAIFDIVKQTDHVM